jgi:hypothetical protein
MNAFLKTAAVLALGFTFQANAFADKGPGQHGNHSNHMANSGHNNGPVHGNQFKNNTKIVNQTTINNASFKNGSFGNSMKHGPQNGNFKNGKGNHYQSYGKYQYCKSFHDYKGPCYKGKYCNFYTTSCWNQSYGCNLYWCPTDACWFYWCQPYGCYLPVEYVPCGGYVFED